MKKHQNATGRHAQLVQLLKDRGYCSIAEMSQLLDVSAMTIRRDLQILQRQQIIDVTYGGARFIAPKQSEPHFDVRTHEHLAAKQAIGKKAVELFIKEDDVIGIDSGSTILEVARNLPDIPLTVVTHSLPAATVVAQNSKHQLIMLGGMLQASSNYFHGPQALAALHSLYINKLFLATSGLLIPEGLSSCYLSDAEMKQALIKPARQVILCMDSSKIGCAFLARFAPLDAIDVLITDTGISDQHREAIEEQNVQVITVAPSDQEAFDLELARDDVAV